MSTESNEKAGLSTASVPWNNSRGCLSTIAKQFVKQAIYVQISRDEALSACEYILSKDKVSRRKESRFRQYLLDSLIQNKILINYSKDIFIIHNVSLHGILIDFTDCYSPLCKTSNDGCYSPTCPRRSLDQFYLVTDDRFLKPNASISRIPNCILNNLSPKEKKRQLAIEELRNYEDNFLKQLNVIHDIFAQPLLLSSTVIEEPRRHMFHDVLFGNYLALATLHKGIFRDLESSRVRINYYLFPDSKTIGQLLFKHFSRLLNPYILYVTNYVAARYQYDLEYRNNVAFRQFIQQQEDIEREFRITLKGLLISPIVRIAKYDLLFATILKNSEKEDQSYLQDLVDAAKEIVYKVNEATRLAEAEYRMTEIRVGLRMRQPSLRRHSFRDQQLISNGAHLLFEGQVDLIKLPPMPPTTCQLFLFSDVLMITRKKFSTDGQEEYILIDRPIPLQMLCIGKTSRSSFRAAIHQQTSLLSSLRRQWSHSKPYRQRHIPSNNRQIKPSTIDSSFIAPSDDDQMYVHADTVSLSGLSIRHRLRSLQQRIRRVGSKTDVLPAITSSKRSNSLPSPTLDSVSNCSPMLQKSATYPSSLVSPQPRVFCSRLLSLAHMADPTLNYLLECPSVDSRLLWRSKIKSALPDTGPFELNLLCSIAEYPSGYNSNRRYNIGCGTIWCSLVFKTSHGQSMIALGTRYGVWVAKDDDQKSFKQILPYNCQQLELFDERILIIKAYKPNRILGGIHIDHVYLLWQAPLQIPNIGSLSPEPFFQRYFKTIHYSGVIHFAIGTLRGNPILCYLRRRRTGSIRLVLMFYRADNDLAAPWFIKFKEYKPLFIQPSDLRIAHDFAFIRSRSEGVEKIDLYSWIYESNSSLESLPFTTVNAFRRPKYSCQVDLPIPLASLSANRQQVTDPALTIAEFIPLDEINSGIICSGKFAYPINDSTGLLPQEIEFEVEAKAVAIFYPYLISFSPHVIEIRHIETAALVQAIPGRKIRCIYACYSDDLTYTKVNMLHVSMFHPEVNQTKIYRLFLK